jgi:hypothetical protein
VGRTIPGVINLEEEGGKVWHAGARNKPTAETIRAWLKSLALLASAVAEVVNLIRGW